jgi:hypothetical protein
MIFDIPPQQFGEKRPWSPWADLSQDTVSLSAVISDALVENAERILFVPTVQLRWAYCDPATNLWSQYSTPERLVATTYALISARVPYITDALSAFTHALQSIGDALDDPAAHGFSPADIPVLQADRITLTALTKRLQTILKHVEAHTMGGRILATEITAQISARLQAAPDFNFRTVHIEGLPFLNGMLRSATRTTRRDPEDPDSTTLLPDVRLTPYAPSDRVEATRPIQRHFDLDRVHGRNVARTYLLDGQAPAAPGNGPYDDGADAEAAPRLPLLRPHGWDWLVRGFLGLARSAEPPPYSRPLNYQLPADETETDDLDWPMWHAWFTGGGYTDPLTGQTFLFDGYPGGEPQATPPGVPSLPSTTASDRQVLDWFDRLLAATLFASETAPFKKIPFIYGPSNTGKSTLFNVIQQLIGSLYGHITNAALLNTRSMKDTSQLLGSVMGRRFITPSSEIPANAQWRSEVVKAYVGNDQLLAERKYENPIEFRPQGGLWVAGNHYLSHEDRDDSMSTRLIYLTFHQPSGRRLSPGEVRQMIDSESDDILAWLAHLHARMRVTYAETQDPAYWGDTAHDYPKGYAPDLDIIATETDPWSSLFEDCFEVTRREEDLTSNDDLYLVFRRWATQVEGMSFQNLPTRAQFVARVLKGRPGIVQARFPKGGPRGSKGIRLTPNGTSLLLDAQANSS